MRSRLIRAALSAAALGLAVPTAAQATLVYTKAHSNKASVWIANDDGTGARRLATNAGLPRIAPDGQTVAYVANLLSKRPSVVTVPAAGGTRDTVVAHWSYGPVRWSPDSRFLLVTSGGENQASRLKLFDTADGTIRTLVRGYNPSGDFSPASDQVVFSAASSFKTFAKTNLYTVPVAGGATRQLTTDGKSLAPLWGPESIAYTRYKRPTGKHRHDDGPKYNLFLLDPTTGLSRRLTDDKVPFLLTGLTPAVWSKDGTKLLADFGGQDTFYGVRVDPATGAERKFPSYGQGKYPLSIAPSALSDDGSTILGYAAPVDSFDGTVLTFPYAGGAPTVLVKHALDPDWTG